MIEFIAGIFVKLYRFYKKWGDKDALFSTSFVLAVLITSTLNLINASIYYLTKYEALKFGLKPVGFTLIMIIVLLTAYFNLNKDFFEQAIIENKTQSKIKNLTMNVVLAFMFSTWVLAPIIYKLGLN